MWCREGAAVFRYKRSRLVQGDLPKEPEQPPSQPAKRARTETDTGVDSVGRKYAAHSKVAAHLVPENNNTLGMHTLMAAAFAHSTWAKHESACKSFRKFEIYRGSNVEWPLTTDVLSDYVTWAFTQGELKASTVESYLSSLKCIHGLRKLDVRGFDSYLVKTLIRGKENLELYTTEVKGTRKVMTLHLLKILGHEIAKAPWSENSKQVVWAAATLAFFGSFRGGELLAGGEKAYCADDTLLWEDVKFGEKDHILVHIKHPKTRSTEGEFVDIFSFEGHNVCPVKAMRKLRGNLREGGEFKKKPVFMFETGICLTRRKFNDIVQGLLSAHIGEEAKHISAHSFRAGIPAALALFPDLCNASDIMGWGRWKSQAYLLYTRLKIEQKRYTFNSITAVLNK